MIYIKRRVLLNPEESFVLMDFDRTLTTSDSSVTWGLLEESPLISKKYAKESLKLYDRYRPIETNLSLDFKTKSKYMEEWYQATAQLLNKYHIYESTIQKIIETSKGITLRKDAKDFLSNMHMLEIPVIIVSAGLGNFIAGYLKKEQCLFDNITIYSNFFIYDGNRVIGVKQPLIHSLNKGCLTYPEIKGRKRGLLFGDQIEDINMGKGLDVISVGFCDMNTYNVEDYIEKFDVTLTGESSFYRVGKRYIKRYK